MMKKKKRKKNEKEENEDEKGKKKTPQNASSCNHFTFNFAIDTKYRKERSWFKGRCSPRWSH